MFNILGNYNTCIGWRAMIGGSNSTNTSNNVAIGYRSLYTNSANDNIGIGYESLYSNTLGI